MSSVRIEQKSYEMAPRDGFTVTHFITVADIDPGKSGVELALCLKKVLPEVKVIFMSGYAGDLIGTHIASFPDPVLIEKPFSRSSLLTTVYSVLKKTASVPLPAVQQ